MTGKRPAITGTSAIIIFLLNSLFNSGIRLGTPALTTRGFTTSDIRVVVNLIHKGLQLALEVSAVSGSKMADFKRVLMEDPDFVNKTSTLRHEVELLALAFPMPGYDY